MGHLQLALLYSYIINCYFNIRVVILADVVCCVSEQTHSSGQGICKIFNRPHEIDNFAIIRGFEECLGDAGCSSYKYTWNGSVCTLRSQLIPHCVDYLARYQDDLTSEQSTMALNANNPQTTQNLALGKPAYQSSTWPGYDAYLAVDGNSEPDFSIHPGSITFDNSVGPNWLVVDLGSRFTIDRVFVTSRLLFWFYSLDYFIVGYTNTFDPVSNPPIRGAYPLCGQYPGKAASGSRLSLACSSITTPARYVIIQQPINGSGCMSIAELEVYGH